MLVAGIVAGDIDLFADLMQRYESRLRRYVVYLINDNSAADDIVQETFIKAYKNLAGFSNKYKFSSWIYRISHNEAINYIKKHQKHNSSDIDNLVDESYSFNYAEKLDGEVMKDDIKRCVNCLPAKYRDIIQLIYFENMKYDEVSDVLKIPISTVGVRLARAKKRLKLICQQRGVKK